MGSLTCLLVLASLMSTLTSQLPKTSYFKVNYFTNFFLLCRTRILFDVIVQIIDYWLLFFLISTSLNIGVHVLVDVYFQKSEKKERMKHTTNVSILIFKRSKYSSAYRFGFSVRRSGHLLKFIELKLRMKFLVSVIVLKCK